MSDGTNHWRTSYRVIRLLALAVALVEMVYSLWTMEWPPKAAAVTVYLVMTFICVAPWLLARWGSTVWWLSYACMVLVTYPLVVQVLSFWHKFLWVKKTVPSGSMTPSLWFMVISGTLLALFFILQILVLPFYRRQETVSA